LWPEHPDKNLVPTYTMEKFVESLEKTASYLLMGTAGKGTDATIQDFCHTLIQEMFLIDGGNTFF